MDNNTWGHLDEPRLRRFAEMFWSQLVHITSQYNQVLLERLHLCRRIARQRGVITRLLRDRKIEALRSRFKEWAIEMHWRENIPLDIWIVGHHPEGDASGAIAVSILEMARGLGVWFEGPDLKEVKLEDWAKATPSQDGNLG